MPDSARRRRFDSEETLTRPLASLLSKRPVRTVVIYKSPPPPSIVRRLEDRRQYYPTKIRPAAALPRAASRLVVKNKAQWALPHTVGFAEPKRVAVCVRRKERKEVLFAKALTKKGGRGGGRRRRNEWSNVKC